MFEVEIKPHAFSETVLNHHLEKFVELPIYTIEDMMSDIGGIVGLLLGLSIIEIVFGFLDMLGRGAYRTWMVFISSFNIFN